MLFFWLAFSALSAWNYFQQALEARAGARRLGQAPIFVDIKAILFLRLLRRRRTSISYFNM